MADGLRTMYNMGGGISSVSYTDGVKKHCKILVSEPPFRAHHSSRVNTVASSRETAGGGLIWPSLTLRLVTFNKSECAESKVLENDHLPSCGL